MPDSDARDMPAMLASDGFRTVSLPLDVLPARGEGPGPAALRRGRRRAAPDRRRRWPPGPALPALPRPGVAGAPPAAATTSAPTTGSTVGGDALATTGLAVDSP